MILIALAVFYISGQCITSTAGLEVRYTKPLLAVALRA